ncbi:hypothetical protein [Streptomyces lydicus]|uniref:hypothetical protein n=1 Tax=Streptomyces lydicus TaxID=47763 RepID=UPI0036E494E7
MTGTVARWWHRVGRRCSQVGGLLLAFVLIGLTKACSREPSERKLRAQATSPGAESRRAVEERQMQALIQRLSTVEGLEHTLTRFDDSCARPYNGSIFENMRSPYVLTCSMRAVAYFGVRGDMSEVLPRIRAAGIATWGPHDHKGRELPHLAGTVTYALSYHRARGRYPDGSLMSAPTLTAPGLRIDWDRADLPHSHRVEEPPPCPPDGSGIYQRCTTVPEAAMSVTAARARYGTVLSLGLSSSPTSSTNHYFTVPRRN